MSSSIAVNNNQYTFKKPRRQCFAFPSDVISHLLMNPKSGNGLEKLYQTCKYFFSKRKILVIMQCGYLKDNILESTLYQNNYYFCSEADVSNIHVLFWLNGKFVFYNPLLTIFKKIFRCSVSYLDIYNVTLSYEDFEFVVAENTVKNFRFSDSSIYYSNKCHVTVDMILRKLPNVEKFEYKNRDEIYSEKTLQNMTLLKMNLIDCLFFIFEISTDFNPALLCKFIEQHPLCFYTVYICNPRSFEIRQSIETALKCISENDITKEFNIKIYWVKV